MRDRRPRTLALLLVLAFCCGPLSAKYGETDARYYFGRADSLSPQAIHDLRLDLKEAHRECTRIKQPCEPAVRMLKTLFGEIYRDKLPDVILYFEEDGEGEARVHPPLVIWNEKLTPYLFGARHLYVLIISDEKMSLDAKLTTIVETTSNPFVAVLSLLKFQAPEQEAPEPESKTVGVAWAPLGDGGEAPYLGWARLDIAQGSINRLSVHGRGETVSRTVTEGCTKCPQEKVERKVVGPEPFPDDENPVPFRELTAHLSNSRPSFAGFGVALGATLDVEDTALGEEGGDVHENAYALAKIFLRRPRLKVGPRARSLYRFSVALVFGTNVSSDPFEELLAGVSVGHLIGKLGITVGVNLVKPAAAEDGGAVDRDREEKLFLGLEYSF